jgi:hypothetical protein
MGFLGVCVVFNYVHILYVSFPHVNGICSVLFFDVMSDGGEVSVYIILCSVQGTKSSCS